MNQIISEITNVDDRVANLYPPQIHLKRTLRCLKRSESSSNDADRENGFKPVTVIAKPYFILYANSFRCLCPTYLCIPIGECF